MSINNINNMFNAGVEKTVSQNNEKNYEDNYDVSLFEAGESKASYNTSNKEVLPEKPQDPDNEEKKPNILKRLIDKLTNKKETKNDSVKSPDEIVIPVSEEITSIPEEGNSRVATKKESVQEVVEDNPVKEKNRINNTKEEDFNEKLVNEERDVDLRYEMELFEKHWDENKSIYQDIEAETGVPAELVAAIHWREATGDFDLHLKDGKKIENESKTNKIKAWKESAIQTLKSQTKGMEAYNFKVEKGNKGSYYKFVNYYNGDGYERHGLVSPYIWSGTDKYEVGKYIEDKVYDPNQVDKQIGVAIMLKHIM